MTEPDERLRRCQRLAAAARLFAARDFDEGTAGHLSARDPDRPGHLLLTPFGVPFAHVRASDIVSVAPSGQVVEGTGVAGRAAFLIHSAIYAVRSDVTSVAHAHSVHGKAWSAFGRLLQPINQEACVFHGRHALYDDFHGAVKDDAEGKGIAAALGATNMAAILRNHGLLTVGGSVDEAAYRFILMDRTCHIQLLVAAAGEPVLVDESVAAGLAAEGDEYCRVSFEPLWAAVTRAQPDLLS